MPASISNYYVDTPYSPYTGTTGNYSTSLQSDALSVSVTLTGKKRILNARIVKLLKDFKHLEDNWDGEDAVAPSEIGILHAFYITSLLEKTGRKIYHAAPGPNGEVMLDIRNEDKTKSIELIFYPQKSVYVTFSDVSEPKQGDFEPALLPELLEWLNMSAHEQETR